MTQKIKLGVLISGGGTNLQALIDACTHPDFPAEIVIVMSNQPDAGGLARAKRAGIPHFVVDHTKYQLRRDFDAELNRWLQDAHVDLVCLAGFMRILTPEFIQTWQGRILNIHPSLLPKFGGKGMYGHHVHAAVITAKEQESGASVHLVTEGCDEGPVILQGALPVYRFDTPETLAARVLELEHTLYPQAVIVMAQKILDEDMASRHDSIMNADHMPVVPTPEAVERAEYAWETFVAWGKISIIAIAALLIIMALTLL